MDNQLVLGVEDFVLCNNGQDWKLPDWLEKDAALEIAYKGGTNDQEGTITLQAMVGNADLYGYFPFAVWVYCDDEPNCVVEFTEGNQTRPIRIRAISGKIHRLRFNSELSGCPHTLGIGPDTRNLAILILSAKWEVKPHALRNPSLTCQGPKLNAIGDHSDIHPIFVIGSYRSATSIATWIMGQHPDIFPIEENGWTRSKYEFARATYLLSSQASRSASEVYDMSEADFMRFEGVNINRLNSHISMQKAFRDKMLGVSEGITGGLVKYNPRFSMMRSYYNPKKRWVDGTPENTEAALGLSRMFPNAKFIFMIRPPRAVIRSLMNFDDMGESAYSFDAAADTWERLNYRAYETLSLLGPKRVHLSLFDKFSDDPSGVIDEWWEFLNEPYFDAAGETARERINSSGDRDVDEVSLDSERMSRLNIIYTGILAGEPTNSLPWTMRFDDFEARSRNVSVRLLDVLGFSKKIPPLPFPTNWLDRNSL